MPTNIDDFNAYKALKDIKNRNRFTQEQSVYEYAKGLRFRINQFYGIKTDNWSYAQLAKFLESEKSKK